MEVLKGAEVGLARCECCGLTEECTEEYVKRIRERYLGRWICGLCSEAVKDEALRSEKTIGHEQAIHQHMTFCRKLKAPPECPTEDLISAVKHLLLRTLDSPGRPRRRPCLDS